MKPVLIIVMLVSAFAPGILSFRLINRHPITAKPALHALATLGVWNRCDPDCPWNVTKGECDCFPQITSVTLTFGGVPEKTEVARDSSSTTITWKPKESKWNISAEAKEMTPIFEQYERARRIHNKWLNLLKTMILLTRSDSRERHLQTETPGKTETSQNKLVESPFEKSGLIAFLNLDSKTQNDILMASPDTVEMLSDSKNEEDYRAPRNLPNYKPEDEDCPCCKEGEEEDEQHPTDVSL